MTLTKKPNIKQENFISNALNDKNSKKDKKIRLTYYMTQDMYIKWEKYKVTQLEKNGNKITFQSKVTQLIEKMLR